MRSGHHHHHHGHDHGHGHSHAPAELGPNGFSRAFAIGVVLNSAFVAVEALAGLLYGSMALIADAGHNLSDVLSLLIAWGASVLAKKPPSGRFTYGLKSSSILAAMLNAALLLVALGAITVEALRRLVAPEAVEPGPIMIVAAIGIVINTATALLFMRGRKGDLNVRGAYLHMVADAAVSAGVVVAGLLIWLTGSVWIDPASSLIIVAIIAVGTWRLLKDSVKMALLAVPDGIDEAAVRADLASIPGVSGVHDLHIWPMSTTETALTAHLIVPDGHPGDAFLHDIAARLHDRFDIDHATIQLENDPTACALRPDDVV